MSDFNVRAFCPVTGRKENISFSIVSTATFDDPNAGIIGMPKFCAIKYGTSDETICENCPATKEYYGKLIQLQG